MMQCLYLLKLRSEQFDDVMITLQPLATGYPNAAAAAATRFAIPAVAAAYNATNGYVLASSSR